MRFDVLTMFPEIFSGYLAQRALRRASGSGAIGIYLQNFADWAMSKHELAEQRSGLGKVLLPQPIIRCLDRVRTYSEDPGHLIMLTPHGRPFNQRVAEKLAEQPRLILLCGRFAGFDPRVREELHQDEISVGDFTLHGGEVAALVIVGTVMRLVPGVLDDE